METIKKSIEVQAPVSDVYAQWTRFEEFPEFMDGIEEVKQLDEKHLHWVAQIAGKRKEWDAEIIEHIPDDHITWRSTSGASNSGAVFFQPKDANHTMIILQMNYEPGSAMEKAADALGILSKRIEDDLERFRDLMETRSPPGTASEHHLGATMTQVAKAVCVNSDVGMKKSHRRSPHGQPRKEHRGFQHFARIAARIVGRPTAFVIALGMIVVWAILGPIFHFSDTWQLVINTATTIVTFLIVFLIQNTQNRDSEAIQIKLDELLRATKGCHNAVLDIEELSEEELDQIKRRYTLLARKAVKELRNGKSDLGIPEMEPEVSAHERS